MRFINDSYMNSAEIIHWMVDAVNKNGTFILKVPGKPDGTNEADEVAILEAIGGWMQINRKTIYATRLWKIFEEGPHEANGGAGGSKGELDAHDIRFTRIKRGDVAYAIVLS